LKQLATDVAAGRVDLDALDDPAVPGVGPTRLRT